MSDRDTRQIDLEGPQDMDDVVRVSRYRLLTRRLFIPIVILAFFVLMALYVLDASAG